MKAESGTLSKEGIELSAITFLRYALWIIIFGLMMFRLILFILFLFILYNVLHTLMKGVLSFRRTADRKFEPEELVQDPWCQTYIPKGSAVKKKLAGRDYYFCSQECLRKYLERKKGVG